MCVCMSQECNFGLACLRLTKWQAELDNSKESVTMCPRLCPMIIIPQSMPTPVHDPPPQPHLTDICPAQNKLTIKRTHIACILTLI